jgi:hypothetical protein
MNHTTTRLGFFSANADPPQGRQPAPGYAFKLQASAPAAKGAALRKGRWLLLILGGLLIAGFAAFFIWWQHYKTTPAYSLALLVDAAQRNDTAALDRLIDLDKVVDNFVPEVAQKATGGYASDVATLLRDQLQSLAPRVVASVKQIIKEEIRKQINELAGASSARPFLLTALAMPFEANISQSDKTAKATMNTGDHQVELTMEPGDAGHWRVISLRDDALAARIVNNIVKDLPGSLSPLNQEMRKQLRENLPGKLRKLPLLSDR